MVCSNDINKLDSFYVLASGLIFSLFLTLAGQVTKAADAERLPVYTDTWPPYVLQPTGQVSGSSLGSAARIVRLVLHDMGYEPQFEYFDFAYGFNVVAENRALISFPYFRTPAREGQVTFSSPLFEVRNRLYYNRQFHNFSTGITDYTGLRFGRVAGYSYGEELDAVLVDPLLFASEQDAMQALLNNAIDLLPMTDSVANALLLEAFPDESELVRPVAALDSVSSLHLIAPMTDEGSQFIERFNSSLHRLLEAQIISSVDVYGDTGARQQNDVVELIAAEGFPIVVGNALGDEIEHFAIPQGTRAMVLQWSERISEASPDEQIYRTMTDESLVVVLNGPHVGKELHVKNMHLQIVPAR